MAIYDLESINEMNTKKNNEDLLDGLVETCDQMLSMIDEGARTKYVEMKEKQAKDLSTKLNSMPDKETVERTGKIGPYGFKYTKDIDNRKAKQDLRDKALDAANTADIYTGAVSSDHSKFIHNAGKPRNRYDKGTHCDKYGIARSTTVDYEAMTASKRGKDRFNIDFGGPNNHDSYTTRKWQQLKPYKSNNGQLTDSQEKSNKQRIMRNKEIIKDELQKKGLIKETCEYILSVIDEM